MTTSQKISNGCHGRREMATTVANGIEIREYVSIINLNLTITQIILIIYFPGV